MSGSNRQYVYLIILLVIAFIIVLVRSYAIGVEWNPFILIPRTRVAQIFLPQWVQYLLMIIVIVAGIAVAVYLERKTRVKV
jgi:hypothetical protein